MNKNPHAKPSPIAFRPTVDILNHLDRKVGFNQRTDYILEALREKMDRERNPLEALRMIQRKKVQKYREISELTAIEAAIVQEHGISIEVKETIKEEEAQKLYQEDLINKADRL